ncbi:hypothetical protein M501DRAFT_1004179 [Patellaria atrata CBS 101060]|uniref:Secreted protein n=1 Tax=Patellaria atrata CBS 101060 TaxID=1346257 RepID=A0A9P4SBA3_9PEZI|nr:hypothetical protein M501DRAFT_1004179 [Patellaria atrata CBS 101060]
MRLILVLRLRLQIWIPSVGGVVVFTSKQFNDRFTQYRKIFCAIVRAPSSYNQIVVLRMLCNQGILRRGYTIPIRFSTNNSRTLKFRKVFPHPTLHV